MSRRPSGVVLVVVALTVAGLVLPTTPAPGVDRDAFLVLLLATALGELIGLRRPDGGQSRLSVAGLVAMATLGYSAVWVLGTAVGAVVVRRVRAWAGDAEETEVGVARLRIGLAGALAGGASVIGALGGPGQLSIETSAGPWHLPVLTIVVLAICPVVGGPFLQSAATAAASRTAGPWRLRLRETWQADAVVAASGLLIAVSYPVLGQAALLLVALPLLAAKVGLDRHAEISLAYRQTLRAMSRLPEELGAIAAGHGVRAGQLAKLAAERVGMDATAIRDLEYAAELHELGLIHAESVAHSAPELLGRAGADVIDEAGAGLEAVAALVEARWQSRASLRDASPAEQLLVLSCELAHRFEDPDRPGTFMLWARAQAADPNLVRAIVDAAILQGWPPLSFGPTAASAGAR